MNKWSVGITLLLASTSVLAKDIQLLNVSYDPTNPLLNWGAEASCSFATASFLAPSL